MVYAEAASDLDPRLPACMGATLADHCDPLLFLAPAPRLHGRDLKVVDHCDPLPSRLPACMGATLANRLDQADPACRRPRLPERQAQDDPGRPIRVPADP